MAQINRSSVVNNPIQELNLSVAVDKAPTELAAVVQPVYIFNPRYSYVGKVGTGATTASVTIYTTPTAKEFYLTSVWLSYTKDVVCDCTSVSIQVYVDGATMYWYLPVQSVTADSAGLSLALPFPLRLDKNSTIKVVGSFTAGAMTKTGSITGFILE